MEMVEGTGVRVDYIPVSVDALTPSAQTTWPTGDESMSLRIAMPRGAPHEGARRTIRSAIRVNP